MPTFRLWASKLLAAGQFKLEDMHRVLELELAHNEISGSRSRMGQPLQSRLAPHSRFI